MTTTPSRFDTPEALIAFVRASLADYLQLPGKVFYSGFDTYQNAQVIFLGYNPGGDGKGQDCLEKRVDRLPGPNWNDYLDDPWGCNWTKPNLLQKRVEDLFQKKLDLDLRTRVFTSNLYFTNTPRAQGLNSVEFEPFKQACWSVIDHFLKAVPAHVVFCNGNKTFWDLLTRLEGDPEPDELFPRFGKHGKRGRVLTTKRNIYGRSRLIIGIPHLSWVPVGMRLDVVADLKHRIMDACAPGV